MTISRRTVLTAGVASVARLSRPFADTLFAAEKQEPPYPIVDTHTHFYDPTRPEGVPWPSKGDEVLYRAVLPKEFKSLTKPFGVTGTVIVEASPWLEDNQWLLDLAAQDPFVLGIVGNLTPGAREFAANLSRFRKNTKFRGFRVNADLVQKGLDKPDFIQDLKRVIDADLELDVNGGPPMLNVVDALAEKLPDLRIVINHLANVRIDGKEPTKEWRGGLKAAARHKRAFLKVSGYVDNARVNGGKSPADSAYYFPVLKAVWETFGEDRLIFGSNWPVSDLAGPYRLIIQVANDFMSDKSPNARKKFFAGNAQTAYRWPV